MNISYTHSETTFCYPDDSSGGEYEITYTTKEDEVESVIGVLFAEAQEMNNEQRAELGMELGFLSSWLLGNDD